MERAKKKSDCKKLVTATNILIAVLVILYLLDCYLPLPKGYNGYSAWDGESPAAINYALGSCGGLLKNYLAMGGLLKNGGAFYRHFTQMFLHDGLLHLIANCVGLYFIGNFAEKRFGRWLTPVLFAFTGLLESYITDPLYLAMFPDKAEEVANQLSVGASGGIFGLIGAGLAAVLFDIKSFENIRPLTIITAAVYGVLPTYFLSLGWTTVCHNVGFFLGLITGVLIILPFFLLKKGKFSAMP